MVFGLVALLTGLEDFLCLLILGLPFLIASGLVGLIIGAIIKGRKINKKLYSIVLIPLFFNPIENLFPNQSDRYVVENKITIHENAATVWNNIIEVPEISEEEYSYGFLNYAGVPRPIKSALEMKDGIEYRVGYFSENIKLYETISEREENRFVNFKMHMDKSQLRNKPTDQHLLKSKNFNFENISYQLIATGLNITELTLRCEYEIESKMNGYANFWAEMIINDFEVRLLETLKLKIEK